MRIHIYISIAVWVSCASVKPTQNTESNPPKILAADALKNVYVIGTNNTISKYQNRNLRFSQNYKIYGNIAAVDCTNPMELYIFYKEANNVVFLDNTLSYRGIIDLSKTQIGMASAICRSYDNGLWVFDQADLQLKKLNKAGEIQQTSGNPIMIAGSQLNPVYMTDDGNLLYMADTANGIIITDLNAVYQKTIPIKGIRQFTVNEDKLYYAIANKVYVYDLKLYSGKVVSSQPKNVEANAFIYHNCMIEPAGDLIFKTINF